jgi:hypothetical protein
MTNRDPFGRCIQALDRLVEVIGVEFDDLSPPEITFILAQLQWTYHYAADWQIQKWREKK